MAVTMLSGCSSSVPDRDRSAEVGLILCASEGVDPVLGGRMRTERCALSVDNRSPRMLAYTIDLACTSTERHAFDAGRTVYYVPPGRHTIAAASILDSVTDRDLACRIGPVSAQELTPEDGRPQPAVSPDGVLAAALARPGTGGGSGRVGTEASSSASTGASGAARGEASAAASASASAAASASASAAAVRTAAAQQKALAQTCTIGDYSVRMSLANPANTTTVDLLLDVTSHDPNTGLARQFGIVVTLQNVDGSVNAEGTVCAELLGGDSQRLEFSPDRGTADWTTVHVTRSPTAPC
ncbi:hypothetical protein AB0F71_32520 [Kitasatospora sp. NPDC028055]|uniref:hypothetical protein n=1 Tax=Kitasatospora sp. NPDC028055 TaxID=3155653 RepID=UPI0033FF1929